MNRKTINRIIKSGFCGNLEETLEKFRMKKNFATNILSGGAPAGEILGQVVFPKGIVQRATVSALYQTDEKINYSDFFDRILQNMKNEIRNNRGVLIDFSKIGDAADYELQRIIFQSCYFWEHLMLFCWNSHEGVQTHLSDLEEMTIEPLYPGSNETFRNRKIA